MELTVTAPAWKQFDEAIRRKLDNKMTETMFGRDMNNLFFVESDKITKLITESPDWKSLTGDMRGEFGFTDAEIANVKGLEAVMAHDPRVTSIMKTGGAGGIKEILLKWVDFQALLDNPMTNHPLTHWDNGWQLTREVNWLNWLENGITFHEFEYEPNPTPEQGKSRSGQGIMVPDPGRIWVYPPTNLFHNLPFQYNSALFMRNVGIVLRKRMRGITR
jgi:hypothetical protein